MPAVSIPCGKVCERIDGMAESVSGGSSSGQPPKEMSMEIRLLLAFLLMGAVMFVTPYFLKTP